jgi:ubiquinone/menaquinone biosynthesis C-methylase UbiE
MATWEDRRLAAEKSLIPWIESAVPLAGKTVLEYGCGAGPVSVAFGARVGRHIGYDIEAAAIADGQAKLAERGAANVELRHAPVATIFPSVEEHAGEVDVFVFYAVLEHMNVAERLEVLELARRVVRPDGAIVICETPNRLILWDWHSSQAPFLAQLPDELALRYYDRAPRQEFIDTIGAGLAKSWAEGQEALTRFGRGMSYHELELIFGDLSRHVLASNWEPELLSHREIHPEEIALARMMDQVRPDLAPAFSRYWLDVVLSASPIPEPPRMMRPWPMDTLSSPGAQWMGTEAVRLPSADVPLVATLPVPTDRVVVGVWPDVAGPVTVSLASQDGGQAAMEQTIDCSGPNWAHATFELERQAQSFTVRLSPSGQVTFVGYDATDLSRRSENVASPASRGRFTRMTRAGGGIWRRLRKSRRSRAG